MAAVEEEAQVEVRTGQPGRILDAVGIRIPLVEGEAPALGHLVLAGHADARVQAEGPLGARQLQRQETERAPRLDPAQSQGAVGSLDPSGIAEALAEDGETVLVGIGHGVLAGGRVESIDAGFGGLPGQPVELAVEAPERAGRGDQAGQAPGPVLRRLGEPVGGQPSLLG